MINPVGNDDPSLAKKKLMYLCPCAIVCVALLVVGLSALVCFSLHCIIVWDCLLFILHSQYLAQTHAYHSYCNIPNFYTCCIISFFLHMYNI